MSLFSRFPAASARAALSADDVVGSTKQHAPIGVTLRGLTKHFGTRPVLKNIHLTIAPGEFVAIVGRSGCGKSTLLRLLAGLDKPSDRPALSDITRPVSSVSAIRGNADQVAAAHGPAIVFDGTTSFDARVNTRIMFQDARLLPWKSVRDNVALGLPDSARASAHDVLSLVGLSERAADWPAVLSGGQRQRVALARALVHRPRLLLLDEPLGALDALTRIEMQQLIENIWQRDGFTSILVTHDVSEAVALADRIVVIEEGQIVFNEKVSLPRPRMRGSAAFAAFEDRVLKRVLKQYEAPVTVTVPSSPPLQIRHLRIAV